MHDDLILSNYDYELPKRLIADRPADARDHSRLMVYDEASDQIMHLQFWELPQLMPDYLPAHTTFILNQTKVMACRLLGHKPSGGQAELFILSLEPSLKSKLESYQALIKCSGKKQVGDRFLLQSGIEATITELSETGSFWLHFNQAIHTVLAQQGMVPIPPYIRDGRSDERDQQDYQTVFAKELGSVAAPTAGLHFTEKIMQQLTEAGADFAKLTLHVGLGTFAPVKAENILEHKMHEEQYHIEAHDRALINQAKFRLAVGTTSLRALESCFDPKVQKVPASAEQPRGTSIFLHPGKAVHSVHGLLTNFHLPQSSLLMLVSALIGRKKCLALYQLAVEKEYRFFSYGDAMLILRDPRRMPHE